MVSNRVVEGVDRSRLQLGLFLAFSLVALLGSLSAALIAVAVTGRSAEQEAVLRLRGAANATVSLLDAERNRDESDAAELAARVATQPELEPASVEQTILGSRQRISDDYVAVLDTAGRPLAEDSVRPGMAPEAGMAARLALAGRTSSAFELRDGRLRIEAAAPVQRGGAVVGAVVAGDVVDSRFLGQIKRFDQLEAALLADDHLLSSTLEEPETETEQPLVAEQHAGNTAERLAAGVQVPIRPWLGGARYVGLLVPLAGTGGATTAVLFLGLPESELSTRQLDLVAPLLTLLIGVLALVLAVSYLVARGITSRLPLAAPSEASEQVALDGLEIDRARREARLDGRPLALTRTEFELLWVLAGAPGRVFTRQELMDRVWGTDFAAESGVIDTHIGNLRRKLEDDPANPRYILTVRGVGFKFREPH